MRHAPTLQITIWMTTPLEASRFAFTIATLQIPSKEKVTKECLALRSS
jgi:hypothetical protein